MSRAYDRVEGSFLDKAIRKMGFSDGWVDLIMNCISSASFSILINGEPKGNVIHQRGLKQGCPLSRYLFLFCAEAFFCLINNAENLQQLYGIRINRRSPTISHLFLVNDSLLFFKGSMEEGHVLKEILHKYEAVSGQQINFQKSALSVSPGTSREVTNDLRGLFEVELVSCHAQYLGLPSSISRNKKNVFSHIRERVNKKVQGWQERLFSSGGKEDLVKAVIQAIPTYPMSILKIPIGLCRDIEKMVNNFWWERSQKKKNLHWRS